MFKATNLSSVGFRAHKVNNTIVSVYENWVIMRKNRYLCVIFLIYV